MLAACYIRVSTDEQTEYSPDAQLKRIREYAEANGLTLKADYTYSELGASGRNVKKRPQFQRLMYDARKKPRPFDVILVHSFDRFARSVRDSRIFKELLRNELGIELISVTEDFGSGKNRFLMEGIKDILNEYYSLNLRDEVLKGMTEKAERGEVQTVAPFGYRVENGVYKQIDEEAELVKMMFDAFVAGDGYLTLARRLNAFSVKTHRGNPFDSRAVRYIINNPVYAGFMRWTPGGREYSAYANERTILVKGIHEPIITRDKFDEAARRAEKLRAGHPYIAAASNTRGDWLSGLVHCSECGSTLIPEKKRGYFVCGGYAKGRCNVSQSVKISVMHKLVAAAAAQMINETTAQGLSVYDAEEHQLKKNLYSLEARARRVSEAYYSGADTTEEYTENKRIINAERERLNMELKHRTDSAELSGRISAAVSLLYTEGLLPAKRRAINTVIKRIIWDKKTLALKIEWRCAEV